MTDPRAEIRDDPGTHIPTTWVGVGMTGSDRPPTDS